MSGIVVSNSSPLIYLAKLNRLSLLRSLFGEVSIPSEVYSEVVRKGKQHGFLEVKCVERAIEEGWLKVREAKRERKLLMFDELDLGEVEVLSMAIQLKASLVLIDDASGRLVAEALGLNSKGTVYVILRATPRRRYHQRRSKESDHRTNLSRILDLQRNSRKNPQRTRIVSHPPRKTIRADCISSRSAIGFLVCFKTLRLSQRVCTKQSMVEL